MLRVALLALVILAVVPCHGEEWSRFRGPNGTGLASDSGYPVEFSKAKNLVWRTPVRKGKSSPVLTESQVFLTAFDDGKLYTQSFDRATGEMLWERFGLAPKSETRSLDSKSIEWRMSDEFVSTEIHARVQIGGGGTA